MSRQLSLFKRMLRAGLCASIRTGLTAPFKPLRRTEGRKVKCDATGIVVFAGWHGGAMTVTAELDVVDDADGFVPLAFRVISKVQGVCESSQRRN